MWIHWRLWTVDLVNPTRADTCILYVCEIEGAKHELHSKLLKFMLACMMTHSELVRAEIE